MVRGLACGVCIAALAAGQARAEEAPPSVSLRPTRVRLLATDFAAGAAAAVVSVPVVLVAASALGQASSNLFLAGLPPLILLLAVPPLAVTLAEVWMSNRLAPGFAQVRPAIWAALGAQLLVMVAGFALGAGVIDLPSVVVFTLSEAVILPAAVTGIFHLKAAGEPPPAPAGILDPSLAAPAPTARLAFAF